MKFLNRLGPATLVTAAFIGPGTIVTCSVAGADFGYALLWALLFSTMATMVLQEMAARLGISRGKGLAAVIKSDYSKSIYLLLAILIIMAIGIGNAAYQSGNIVGASIGAEQLFKRIDKIYFIVLIGVISFLLLYTGKYMVIERTLMVLVASMGLVFVVVLFFLPIDFLDLLKGVFVPRFPSQSIMPIMALIGTTIVPYNLFLHSSSAAQKWSGDVPMNWVRQDIFISIGLGGIISMCILTTAAASLNPLGISINSIAEIGAQLEPVAGSYATMFISLGIFAAGLTSSITAPLAAAFAITEILGLKKDFTTWQFRLVWIMVLFIGCVIASLEIHPVLIIQSAQFTNGLLLPIIGVILLIVMNSSHLGDRRNGLISNLIGGIIILLILGLGIRSVLIVFGLL